MCGADFAPEKIESFCVVNQRVVVEVFEIGAGRGDAARRVGPVGAAGGLFSGGEFAIEAADVIGKEAAAMAGADF